MQQPYTSPTEEDLDSMDDKTLDCYQEVTAPDGKKFCQCTVPGCGKVFRFKSEISRHIVVHFPSRPYHCQIKGCNKTFKRNDALENHMRIHTQSLSFVCDFTGCSHKFSTKERLKYHCMKHNLEQQYKCTFAKCNKSFLTISQLKQHQRAFTSHCEGSSTSTSASTQKLEEKDESCTTASLSEYHSPVQKHAHLDDEKCILPQEKQEERALTSLEENLQNMLKYVLNENSMLVKKLEFCDKLITSLVDKYSIKTEYVSPLNEFAWKEPNSFFNQSDSLFLDYLKEKREEQV